MVHTRDARRVLAIVALALVTTVTACGDRASPMAEYVEGLNGMVAEYTPRGEAIWLSYVENPNPSVRDFASMMETEAAFREEIVAAFLELEAPSRIADEHERFATWTEDLRSAEGALARRAATAASWDEIAASAEFVALEDLFRSGVGLCTDLKTSLDSSDTAELFEDIPWVPTDLADAVDALLGCDTIPEDLAAALGH